MPNKSTEQMIEEALKEFDSEFHIQTVETNEFGITHIFPLDDEGRMFVPDVSDLKGFIRAKLNLIASKSAEEAQSKRIEIKQIIGTNAVFLLPSNTEQVEGFWHNREYRVKGIDVTKDIQEALSQPKENHD